MVERTRKKGSARAAPTAAVTAATAAIVASTALGAAFWAGPAFAGVCELVVYRSDEGRRGPEADTVFAKLDQFQVCFRATKAGYVTLWDRIPTSGPVERLVPGEFYTGDGTKAARVAAGETRCFGDGSDGYYLQMDPADGDGLGLMWLVFTEDEQNHPELASFDTPNAFAAEYSRFGAGTVKATRPAEQAAPAVCDTPQSSLQYLYRVQ